MDHTLTFHATIDRRLVHWTFYVPQFILPEVRDNLSYSQKNSYEPNPIYDSTCENYVVKFDLIPKFRFFSGNTCLAWLAKELMLVHYGT